MISGWKLCLLIFLFLDIWLNMSKYILKLWLSVVILYYTWPREYDCRDQKHLLPFQGHTVTTLSLLICLASICLFHPKKSLTAQTFEKEN